MNTNIRTVEEVFLEYNKGFEIPHFQRGYRWRKENIEELIDDIYNDEQKYCLQPIIFNLGTGEKTKEQPDIVDGQQRLTTISLIGEALNWENKEICESLKNNKRNNIDKHFLKIAKETIEAKIRIIDNSKLKTKLKECIFIVCTLKVENKEAEKIFLRLNDGKIPLSPAEIFKAYCLTEYKEECKRINFIGIWNRIESILQDDDFYYFFSQDDKTKLLRYYSTRMDFFLEVFALIFCGVNSPKTIKEEYEKNPNFIFNKLSEWIVPKHTPKDFIDRLGFMFEVFQRVYSDISLYNLFGFISCHPDHKEALLLCKTLFEKEIELNEYCLNEQIIELIDSYLHEQIHTSIGKIVPDRLYLRKEDAETEKNNFTLIYGHDNRDITKILLLHNALKSIKHNYRFNYNAYRNNTYNLEHINAKASISSKKLLTDVLIKNKNELRKKNESFYEYCIDLCNTDDTPELQIKNKLKIIENCIWALQCGGSVTNHNGEWKYEMPSSEQDSADAWKYFSIRNLCLLQESINKSIGCNDFEEKKRAVTWQIYSSTEELPIVTAMIFNVIESDFHSTAEESMWTREIGDIYLKDIVDTLIKEGI